MLADASKSVSAIPSVRNFINNFVPLPKIWLLKGISQGQSQQASSQTKLSNCRRRTLPGDAYEVNEAFLLSAVLLDPLMTCWRPRRMAADARWEGKMRGRFLPHRVPGPAWS
jgi:hypothetical protein